MLCVTYLTVTTVAIFAARIAGIIDKVALFLPEAPRATITTKDENLLSSVRAGHRRGFDPYVELRLQESIFMKSETVSKEQSIADQIQRKSIRIYVMKATNILLVEFKC